MQSLLKSKDNPLAKKFRLVAMQARRAPKDLVLAEGVRLLEEATRSGHPFDAILISERFGEDAREKALLEEWESRGIHPRRANLSLLRSLSEVVSTQEALALVALPKRSLADVQFESEPLVLCGAGIQDPGNLGTLLRTAAASGVSFFCSTSGTVSARNPKCVRSSAGLIFSLPVVEGIHPQDLRDFCKARGIQLLLASAHDGCEYTSVNLRLPTAIILGNESRGVPPADWAGLPGIRIPTQPSVESLNVASAGAVLLFEAARQRRSAKSGAMR